MSKCNTISELCDNLEDNQSNLMRLQAYTSITKQLMDTVIQSNLFTNENEISSDIENISYMIDLLNENVNQAEINAEKVVEMSLKIKKSHELNLTNS